MRKILLTVPHGSPYINDVAAPPVAEKLSNLLTEANIWHETFINTDPRSTVDMNRPQSRGTEYRNKIDSALRHRDVGLLLDIHSFPSETGSPFKGFDMVVLGSYEKLQESFPQMYRELLCTLYPKNGVRVGVMKADVENDVVKRSYEFGVPAVLIEHDECGPLGKYAYLHFLALKTMGFGKR